MGATNTQSPQPDQTEITMAKNATTTAVIIDFAAAKRVAARKQPAKASRQAAAAGHRRVTLEQSIRRDAVRQAARSAL
jgi:hypothetical protein